jgi:hypothetical protein
MFASRILQPQAQVGITRADQLDDQRRSSGCQSMLCTPKIFPSIRDKRSQGRSFAGLGARFLGFASKDHRLSQLPDELGDKAPSAAMYGIRMGSVG